MTYFAALAKWAGGDCLTAAKLCKSPLYWIPCRHNTTVGNKLSRMFFRKLCWSQSVCVYSSNLCFALLSHCLKLKIDWWIDIIGWNSLVPSYVSTHDRVLQEEQTWLDLGTRIQRHWVFGRDILEELNKKEKKKYSYYIGYPGLNLRDLFHADFPTFLTFEWIKTQTDEKLDD